MFLSEVIGNLGSDAELKENEAGRKYVTFNVAHTEFTKDTLGNPVEKTVWINVMWYSFTDKMFACLKKGTKVFITGRTKVTVYIDGDKILHPSITIFASIVELCGIKNTNGVQLDSAG